VFEFCDRLPSFERRCRSWRCPTSYHQVTEDELADHGVNVVIYANHMLRRPTRRWSRSPRPSCENGRALEADPYPGRSPTRSRSSRRTMRMIDPAASSPTSAPRRRDVHRGARQPAQAVRQHVMARCRASSTSSPPTRAPRSASRSGHYLRTGGTRRSSTSRTPASATRQPAAVAGRSGRLRHADAAHRRLARPARRQGRAAARQAGPGHDRACSTRWSCPGPCCRPRREASGRVERGGAAAVEHAGPFVLLVEKDTFADDSSDPGRRATATAASRARRRSPRWSTAIGDGPVIVSTTGMLSRELFELRERDRHRRRA
jgi:hypothetical protein